jgi:AAA+ superfamily predicted ATPase
LKALGKALHNGVNDDDDDEGEIEPPTEEELAAVARVTPPVHPYIRVFDLDKHDFVTIHVNNLQDYPWDDTLIDKLVLPAATKDMIQILVSGTRDSKEDIIRGKMQGVIVIATGEPGTGKTLTAEVFSETIKRPLYVVQCAQLGTDADDIEKHLSAILRRAQRWQAILLIDEADVYIRARGDDIQQNAIVGVFLRVLEYYRGVLFMTSNRATVIDDAIMSRASSWIRYAMPGTDELRRIWKVLSTQYEVELTEQDIDSLLQHLPKLSGRCVRNLLKLARHLSQARKERVTEAMLRSVAQFQYLPHQSDQELRDAAK